MHYANLRNDFRKSGQRKLHLFKRPEVRGRNYDHLINIFCKEKKHHSGKKTSVFTDNYGKLNKNVTKVSISSIQWENGTFRPKRICKHVRNTAFLSQIFKKKIVRQKKIFCNWHFKTKLHFEEDFSQS